MGLVHPSDIINVARIKIMIDCVNGCLIQHLLMQSTICPIDSCQLMFNSLPYPSSWPFCAHSRKVDIFIKFHCPGHMQSKCYTFTKQSHFS